MHNRYFWSKINHVVGYFFYLFILGYFVWSIVNIADRVRSTYVGSDKLSPGGAVINIIALIFEILGFFFALYFAIQLIDGVLKVGEKKYDLSAITGESKVSVIVPIHNVQPVILKETLIGFSNQTYDNFDVWVADDSTDEELRKECEQITNDSGFTYFYRDNKNFKSGMLNLVIPETEGDYITFFDVDHVPEPEILEKFVAILEQYPEYYYIQARFGFRNVTNLLHVWEAMSLMQTFCSENARREIDTVLYSGSCAIFRREVAYPIPENQMTEDFDHSIQLILSGKKGYFLDEVGSMSLVPETMHHQITQLFRWFTGQSGAIPDHGWDLIKGVFRRKISLRQAIDIVFSSVLVVAATSFYPMAIVYAIIYFTKTPLVRAWFLGHLWLIVITSLTFIIYFATMTATTLYSMKSARFNLKIWHVPFFLTFGSLTAPFYMIPAFKGLVGKNKLIPGKTQWNKKIPIYRNAAIFSFFGLFFLYLTIDSIFQQLCFNFNLSFCYYSDPYANFFFILFGLVGLTLTFSLPFIYINSKIFKPLLYKEKHIFH